LKKTLADLRASLLPVCRARATRAATMNTASKVDETVQSVSLRLLLACLSHQS
jgi:hypothetical protein